MRHESAVSEILGAVILIGLVIAAFAIIGMTLLSETPTYTGGAPVATTGSHCVKCSEGWYETYVKHDGGEPYVQNQVKFKVIYQDHTPDEEDVTPIAVYYGQPQECTGSSDLVTDSWHKPGMGTGAELFGPGQVAQISLEALPKSIILSDLSDNTLASYTYEAGGEPVYKDLTQITTTSDSLNLPGSNTMTGTIKPILEGPSITEPDELGYCEATFYYSNTLGVTVKANPCAGNPLIINALNNKITGDDICTKPWNEFVGVGNNAVGFEYLKKDMGQPKVFEPNEKPGQSIEKRSFTFRFKNAIKWRLGNSVSATAVCGDYLPEWLPPINSCRPQETFIWGNIFYDLNKNGLRDFDEPGFDEGRIHLIGRYKNNPNTDPFDDVYTPSQGQWSSRCIQMSGWAFSLTAVVPPEYEGSTVLSYPNYDDKMTGQDKKNPPRIDFGIYLREGAAIPTPTPLPTESPTPAPTSTPEVDIQPPSVTVSSPVAGEEWKKHTSKSIFWTASDNVGVTQIEIKLSRDGGSTYPDILLDTSSPEMYLENNNNYKYIWTVPANKKTDNAKIKIIAYDSAGNPGSGESGVFKITN